MKILGIGNAIVDVICKVDDNFIVQNNLTKSTMKLFFDEIEFKNLLSNLKIKKTVSGGSLAGRTWKWGKALPLRGRAGLAVMSMIVFQIYLTIDFFVASVVILKKLEEIF